MPIYEYRCNHCDTKSSHFFRRISDDKLPTCPQCQNEDMRRVMSTFRVRIPWYSGINLPSTETLTDFDQNDSKSTSEWINGMRRDMGDSFGSSELGELTGGS